MNTFLKGLVGAAALAGVSFSTASAQDYTWTLNMQWGVGQITPDSTNYFDNGDEPIDAAASGTITFTRTGASSWNATSWNITTTGGTEELGTNATMFATTYTNVPNDDDLAGSVETPLATPWQEYIDLYDAYGDFKLTLRLPLFDLINKMNDETEGAVVELVSGESSETNLPAVTDSRRRKSGTCELSSFEAEECGEGERSSGTLSLTSIVQPPPTATPEPASMALFGAGLLGLFAARRRRAA